MTDVVTGVALAIDPVPWARAQMAFTLMSLFNKTWTANDVEPIT